MFQIGQADPKLHVKAWFPIEVSNLIIIPAYCDKSCTAWCGHRLRMSNNFPVWPSVYEIHVQQSPSWMQSSSSPGWEVKTALHLSKDNEPDNKLTTCWALSNNYITKVQMLHEYVWSLGNFGICIRTRLLKKCNLDSRWAIEELKKQIAKMMVTPIHTKLYRICYTALGL